MRVERHVEAGFEPARDAVRPFGHAVPRVVGGDSAGDSRRRHALRRDVVVYVKLNTPRGASPPLYT